MATLHDYSPRGIVVMEGRHRLAVARNKGRGKGWLLKATGFSWTDPRARDTTRNPLADKFPYLMLVRTKREAMRILKDIARDQRGRRNDEHDQQHEPPGSVYSPQQP